MGSQSDGFSIVGVGAAAGEGGRTRPAEQRPPESLREHADRGGRRHIPFAFLTGCAQQELPEERRDHIVLNKPVERSALLSTIGKLLAG